MRKLALLSLMIFACARAHPEDVARSHLEKLGLEETVALTGELVHFPTVSETETSTGPSFTAMGAHLKQWAEKNGMRFEVFGKNDVYEIHLGEGEPYVAFVMHGDVVPADPKEWKTTPFELKRDGDRLYGRGSEDDKGPIAAVLTTMRALKLANVTLPGRVSAVIGNGEEHDWTGMKAYAKERPHAKYVISLDSSYPVVVAESGFVAWSLSAPIQGKARAKGCADATADVGRFLTVVPGEATMTITGAKREAIESAIAKVRKDRFTFELKERGASFDVIAKGEGIHSSQADEGHNALWALSRVASELPLCEGGVSTLLKAVAAQFDGDHWGEKLGLQHEHPLMGKLLVAPTMLKTDEDRAVLSVNMRRPAGKTKEEFEALLEAALKRIQQEISPEIVEDKDRRWVGDPALAETGGPLVRTLLEIYRAASGDAKAEVTSIRGGTYARLFPGAVSFGPAIPGRKYRGHAPDEYIELDALELMSKTTLEAVLKLRTY